MRINICLPFCLGVTLLGQAMYQPRPSSDKSCPRVDAHEDTMFKTGGDPAPFAGLQGTTKPQIGASRPDGAPNTISGAVRKDQIVGSDDTGVRFAKEVRTSASAFGVADIANKTTSVADVKGKVLVIGFWDSACGPSVNLLQELVELQAKGEKYNFEVWPVCLNSDRWTTLIPFINRNKSFLEKTRIYLPGIGASGPSVLMNVIPALPALFILDKEGKVAFRMMGYEPKAAVNALKVVLKEP